MRGTTLEVALEQWRQKLNEGKYSDCDNLMNILAIQRLAEWCIKKGWTIVAKWHSHDQADFENKIITLDKSHPPRVALHYFIHECGHVLIGEEPIKFVEDYGDDYHAESEKSNALPIHRIAVVQEEMEAWTRGFKLARRLGIHLDQDEYNSTRVKALRSYMSWALKSKEYE